MGTGFVNGGGVEDIGWSGKRINYFTNSSFSCPAISLTLPAGASKSEKILTISCQQDITLSAKITTNHSDVMHSWYSGSSRFIVYDAAMIQICTFSHSTSSGSGITLGGDVQITLKKGINHIFFSANNTGSPYELQFGFSSFNMTLNGIYPEIEDRFEISKI